MSALTHLDRLEAESIHILRETVAEASRPVMLYSIGKDSAVMLHLAKKAFYPAPLPFPLLHVDTTWKFRDMYALRDKVAGDWPGRDFGLSAREAEIIALITQGLSNQEIAQRSYLSINSVKTYIRTAYRKMGVASRSQAVLWGVRHGFQPDIVRAVSVDPG